MRINPVYKKDSRIGNRSVRFVASIMGYNIILIFIGFVFLFSEQSKSVQEGITDYSTMLELYILFTSVQMAMMLFITPAMTGGTISGERERRTLDMLLATHMRPRQILLGKLYSSLDTTLILAISTMPVLALVFIYGGLRFSDLFVMQAVVVILMATLGAAGVFFSTVYRNSTVATIASYIYIAFLAGGSFGIVFLFCTLGETVGYPLASLTRFSIYLLLLNPVMTFYILMNHQVGDESAVWNLINRIGNGPYERDIVLDNWVAISLVLQIIMAVLFLHYAARNLEPIKTKRRKLF